ncbi:MAG: AraC family transcriptional regulator [Pseudomonadota bacterium]
MEARAPAAVLLGPFGRAALSMASRAVVAHAHAELNVLLHVGGGDTAFRSGTESLPLDPEHLIVLNPWTTHAKAENAGEPTLLLSLLIDTAWLKSHGANQEAGQDIFPHRSVKVTPSIRALAHKLVRTIQGVDALSDHAAHVGMVHELVAAVSDSYAQKESISRVTRVDSRVRKAIAYIQQHAAGNPDLVAVAAHAGLSRSQFFAQFKHSVGVTPQHYLDWVRLGIAVELLADPKLALAEVAAQLGFYAPSHFTRFFTQHVAIPPSEFRRGLIA